MQEGGQGESSRGQGVSGGGNSLFEVSQGGEDAGEAGEMSRFARKERSLWLVLPFWNRGEAEGWERQGGPWGRGLHRRMERRLAGRRTSHSRVG